MQKIFELLYNAANSCTAKHLALSGGLDSTILAYLLKEKKPDCLVIISKDHIAHDLTYSQMAAKEFGLPLSTYMYDILQILDAIEQTIKILGNFNDIEIRNNVVPYLAISEVKKQGFDKIITGDGADELFAGYNFLMSKSDDELKKDLARIAKIMHFPSQKIGKALGVTVESPFCHQDVVEFASGLSPGDLVGTHDDKKYGKFILRKTFENTIPNSIVWRQKSPMQEGAGTQGLTGFFDWAIPDDVFFEKARKIKSSDNVTIRTKESMHYYEIFKKYHTLKQSHDNFCPDCRGMIEENSRFCRMCGRFPI
ncbi:asparagine synthase C-terminal domain-containing protein [Candidatus Nitrosotenuis aquarius]|uniref:asparagine synthase C-terminal domain-containing protein n=1 Tax=Candidatus Nitrosotenuis aquarius TaxID=1846278 RepID=UPI000C1E018D|nr:asparagine synthase-related protein [Candidatus Nitrosotenuis aquarius]